LRGGAVAHRFVFGRHARVGEDTAGARLRLRLRRASGTFPSRLKRFRRAASQAPTPRPRGALAHPGDVIVVEGALRAPSASYYRRARAGGSARPSSATTVWASSYKAAAGWV